MELFFTAFCGVMAMMTLLWIISIFIRNVSIVDIFWGIAFIVVNTIYYLNTPEDALRSRLVFWLVIIWGLRLSSYLLWRNYGKPEDYRYREFRQKYGPKRYWWVSFFQVFLLQGVLVMLISLPLLGIHIKSSEAQPALLDWAALLIWSIGFFFETVGDYQLARFKKDPANKGKLLTKGLWKYTRHPNYFGDAAVWWGFGLFAIASGAWWQSLGAVLMTWLILKVSGVSLLEGSLQNSKPGYEDYIKRTSAFIPWFPKNKKS